jgi:hypothetical protein
MRAVAVRTLEEAAKALASDGLDGPLDAVRSMLADVPEYERQRDLCEREGMPSLLADLVARTVDLGG